MKSSPLIAICLAVLSITKPCSSLFDLNPLTWIDQGPIFGQANLRKMGFSFEDHKPPDIRRGINGGMPCAACSVVLGITEQLAQIHNETVPAAMERLCDYLPLRLQSGCEIAARYVAPFVLAVITNTTSPDTLCYDLGVCYVEPGKAMCHLFPLPRSLNEVERKRETRPDLPPREYVDSAAADLRGWPWICYVPGVYYVCEAFDDVYDQLLPAVDHDGDRYSPAESLRGSIWRGRDCNDFKKEVYPGRRPMYGDAKVDSNCNGIYGTNKTSGIPLEEELCGGSGQRGIIYIGDSVGAHFRAPPQWFTPSLLSSQILQNMSYVISNEFDWPHLGR